MKNSTSASGAFSKTDKTRTPSRVTAWDWTLFVLLLTLSLLSLYLLYRPHPGPKEVWVSEGGKVFGIYPLSQNRVIRVKGPIGTTVISIHDGEVAITSAPCPHKFCQKMGPIPRRGRIMVCIPNQIIVEIKGSKERGADAVSR